MPSVTYALRHLQALCVECRYAECCYAECCHDACRYAECRYADSRSDIQDNNT
jgi:hypothetical protein